LFYWIISGVSRAGVCNGQQLYNAGISGFTAMRVQKMRGVAPRPSPCRARRISESAKTPRVSERFRAFHVIFYVGYSCQKRACFRGHMRLKKFADPAYAFQSVSKRFIAFH